MNHAYDHPKLPCKQRDQHQHRWSTAGEATHIDHQRPRRTASARQRAISLLLVLAANCLILNACGSAIPLTAPSRHTHSRSTSKMARHPAAPAPADAHHQQNSITQVSAAAREQTRVQGTASAIQRMLIAIRAGGGNAQLAAHALCKQLSAQARDELTSTTSHTAHPNSCVAKIGDLLEQPEQTPSLVAAAKGQIVNVRTHGTHSTVTLQLPHDKTLLLQLVKEVGAWKLATTPTSIGS